MVVGDPVQAVEEGRHFGLPIGVHGAEVLADVVERHPGVLHVGTVEADIPTGLVVLAHPLDHLEDRFGAPGPEVEGSEERVRVPLAGPDVAVEATGFRPGGFDHEGVEVHFFDEKSEDPGLHLEEVPRTVGVLPERDDAGVSHDVAQELEIVVRQFEVRALERDGVRLDPARDGLGDIGQRLRRRSRGGRLGNECLWRQPDARRSAAFVAGGEEQEEDETDDAAHLRSCQTVPGGSIPCELLVDGRSAWHGKVLLRKE